MAIEEVLRQSIHGSKSIIILSDRSRNEIAFMVSKLLRNSPVVLIGNNITEKNLKNILINDTIVCCFDSRKYSIYKKLEDTAIKSNKSIVMLLDWKMKHFENKYWKVGNLAISNFGKGLKSILEKTRTVRVIGVDFDFSVDVKNKKWVLMDGICKRGESTQLPDGEIFTDVTKDDITGNYRTYKRSKLVEFGIGINANLDGRENIVSFDEKAFGTVHLGFNTHVGHRDFVIGNIRLFLDGKRIFFKRKDYLVKLEAMHG